MSWAEHVFGAPRQRAPSCFRGLLPLSVSQQAVILGRKIFDGLSKRLAGKLNSGEVRFPCSASLVRCSRLCLRDMHWPGPLARTGRVRGRRWWAHFLLGACRTVQQAYPYSVAVWRRGGAAALPRANVPVLR